MEGSTIPNGKVEGDEGTDNISNAEKAPSQTTDPAAATHLNGTCTPLNTTTETTTTAAEATDQIIPCNAKNHTQTNGTKGLEKGPHHTDSCEETMGEEPGEDTPMDGSSGPKSKKRLTGRSLRDLNKNQRYLLVALCILYFALYVLLSLIGPFFPIEVSTTDNHSFCWNSRSLGPVAYRDNNFGINPFYL